MYVSTMELLMAYPTPKTSHFGIEVRDLSNSFKDLVRSIISIFLCLNIYKNVDN